MSRTPFADLYFGKSDPKFEVMANADDFVRSFVDVDGAVQDVVSGQKTLILGPKGTGKSALGVFLEETGGLGQEPHLARMRNASVLPLAEIPQLDTGQPRGATRTYSAWKFILLANYLDVALSDPGVRIGNLREIRRVISTLESIGFVTGESGKSLLRLSDTTYAIDKSSAGNLFKNESGSKVTIYTLLPYLERWALAIRSQKRHILLLDGLDSIFLNDAKYDESLAGLAQAAHDLNLNFSQKEATGSIVLLIRNDIFSRISLILPDAHKMRDFAYELDWRILSGAAGENAPLIQLVNRKASQDLGGEHVDVLSYFPARIQVGQRRGARRRNPVRLQYLLNLTRHTPRDVLQLMEHIRLTEAAQNRRASGESALSDGVIREGVVQYSTKYFVDAIKGELAGYEGGREECEQALNVLKAMSPQFTRTDFRSEIALQAPGLEAKSDTFLRLFFFAGALGNLFSNGAERYMVFYHRRDDVDLNVQGTLVLHNALTHAWSRQFGMRPHGV